MRLPGTNPARTGLSHAPMLRYLLVILGFGYAAVVGRAVTAPPNLLEQCVQSWLGERDHWAFTQRAVEYQDGVTHERLERYDPSKSGNARWELLAIDGQKPTPLQYQKWAEKKFKHHHHARFDAPIGDYFDFDNARVVAQTPALIRYDVPLRRDKNWLFPTSKVDVRVTINKETRALEHLTAYVREPFKVLLGVAHVTGGKLDLDFLPLSVTDAAPGAAKPTGSAQVSVSRMGERVDFTWSDFKRVTPNRSADATAADDE